MSSESDVVDQALRETIERIKKEALDLDDEARLASSRRPIGLIELFTDGAQVTVVDNRFGRGARIVSKPVTITALSDAFHHQLILTSGVLPENAVWWSNGMYGEVIGCFQPARRRAVTYAGYTYDLPFPAMLFAGRGSSLYIYALREDQMPHENSMLYYPPMPNVFGSCRLCRGNNTWGDITARNIWQVWDKVWDSEFTPHVIANRSATFSANVADLWRMLDGADEFPVNELVSTHTTLQGVM